MMDIKELYKLYQQHPCITTDSRNCPEGSIFLALKGESFNGNQFALQALEKGCAYAIVDEAPSNFPQKGKQLLKLRIACRPSRTWLASIVANLIYLSLALRERMARPLPRN